MAIRSSRNMNPQRQPAEQIPTRTTTARACYRTAASGPEDYKQALCVRARQRYKDNETELPVTRAGGHGKAAITTRPDRRIRAPALSACRLRIVMSRDMCITGG